MHSYKALMTAFLSQLPSHTSEFLVSVLPSAFSAAASCDLWSQHGHVEVSILILMTPLLYAHPAVIVCRRMQVRAAPAVVIVMPIIIGVVSL